MKIEIIGGNAEMQEAISKKIDKIVNKHKQAQEDSQIAFERACEKYGSITGPDCKKALRLSNLIAAYEAKLMEGSK
jgi:aspartyl-tRNA synthetase